MFSALQVIPVLLCCTLGEAITGGSRAAVSDFPYQISIWDSIGHPFCGGAIISSRWIITSATCAKVLENQFDGKIADGTPDASKPRTIRAISEKVIHPDYNSPPGNANIALIKVATDFYFDFYTQAVTFNNKTSPVPGDEGFVAGWGALHYNGPDSDELMYARMTVIEHSECKASLEGNYQLNADQFCAGQIGAGISTCTRDSGSPMTADNVLIGLVANNYCSYNGFPTPFTKVGHYRDWILSVAGV
ncbi:trypsin-6-like [Neocloeon triangulifer]|uniref:trypsin-6-like n=1 Tax=Neocloeon triangulifer TaxID=2078957 RepID=UPI00286F6AEF|nr:trypsin-6-like [Neocloeon triangulifer]